MRRRDLIILLGGAITLPAAASAQQKAVPVIGFLSTGSLDTVGPLITGFYQGLREAGYVVGQNVAIEHRWVEGRYDRLPALAAELVGRKVEVIMTGGGASSTRAANSMATRSRAMPPFVIGSDLWMPRCPRTAPCTMPSRRC